MLNKFNIFFKQTESFNLRVIAKLKSLQMLDGQVVSRKDTIDSSKLVAGTKVSSVSFCKLYKTLFPQQLVLVRFSKCTSLNFITT